MSPYIFLRILSAIRHRIPAGDERDASVQKLLQDAGAKAEVKNGRLIGWMLPGGRFICRKRRYRDRDIAIKVIIEIQRVDNGPLAPTDAYQCDACKGWHITTNALALRRLQTKDQKVATT